MQPTNKQTAIVVLILPGLPHLMVDGEPCPLNTRPHVWQVAKRDEEGWMASQEKNRRNRKRNHGSDH